MTGPSMNRRDFARLFAAGGSAALLGHPRFAGAQPTPLTRSALRPAAVDWEAVRAQFTIPEEVSVLNAANLCPAPRAVLEDVAAHTTRLDSEPFPSYRSEIQSAKETTRDRLAAHLRVSPEEILITRNTSEANNWVSTGLDLGPGDEVLIFSDNHPSNNRAWKEKGARFGYTVVEVPHVDPHPGAEYYLEAFEAAITPRTRVMTLMQHTNTSGDVFPAKELCAMAHERGVLTLVDGAQSFGLFDVDLSDWQPDFFSGSAHKWLCGPKEAGVLFVNQRVHDRFHPSVYSAYTGSRGISRTHEGLGQRDTPTLHAFGGHIAFLGEIGQGEIEARSRELATMLVEELSALDEVHMWTPAQAERRGAVVTFRPGELDARRVIGALEEDGIVAAARGGSDRPGIRFSPHFYNSERDCERAVEAIRGYLRTGL
ncbi:MAG: aminotransferase class V-fold PLP-dependent enzyme [Longimicrobiales bacterium]|jgi:isopenicillin-N epimerase|nr:aminotransferase class V-fold PLP-dependent enzyme [Longimicrobiales bacterium]